MNRILWNRRVNNEIDEIVVDNISSVHIEQMGDRKFWIGIYLDNGVSDGPYWMGNFIADSRGHLRFMEQENAGVEWDHDETHEDYEITPLEEDT